MHPSLLPAEKATAQQWVYVSLMVIDGDRRIKPAQVGPDRLLFTTPPRLTSDAVEVIVTNGNRETRQTAVVLPHDPDATRIPIRLLPVPAHAREE